MKKITVFIISLFLAGAPQSALMSKRSEIETGNFNLNHALECSWNNNYESVIKFIKNHEGFNKGQIYLCPAGSKTIGYGHIIREGEVFPESGISKKTADSLLRADFAKAVKLAGYHTNLRGSRKLAVAHFIYSKGPGAFCRSRLKKAIENDTDVDKEFAKWCYYTNSKTGKKTFSKVAKNITDWESRMYHKDDIIYAYAKTCKKTN